MLQQAMSDCCNADTCVLNRNIKGDFKLHNGTKGLKSDHSWAQEKNKVTLHAVQDISQSNVDPKIIIFSLTS